MNKQTFTISSFLLRLLWLPTAIAQQNPPKSPRLYSDSQCVAKVIADFAAADQVSPLQAADLPAARSGAICGRQRLGLM